MIKKTIFVGILILVGLIGIFYANQTRGEDNFCNQQYLNIVLSFSEGQFSLLNKSLEFGCTPKSAGSDFEYQYKTIADQGDLFTSSFNTGFLSVDHFDANGDAIAPDSSSSSEELSLPIPLSMPYTGTEKEFSVFKDGVKVFSINLDDLGAVSCRIA